MKRQNRYDVRVLQPSQDMRLAAGFSSELEYDRAVGEPMLPGEKHLPRGSAAQLGHQFEVEKPVARPWRSVAARRWRPRGKGERRPVGHISAEPIDVFLLPRQIAGRVANSDLLPHKLPQLQRIESARWRQGVKIFDSWAFPAFPGGG